MLRTILCTAAMIVAVTLPLAPAIAQDDKLIEAIGPEIAEVDTGGSWSQDKQGGFYRGIVVMSGGAKGLAAHVYLQWLAFQEGNPVPTVVKTVPIKEVNDQNLANATLSIEGEEGKDNEVTLVVSSYDFDEDKDITEFVKGGLPGTYTMSKAPPKGAAAPEGDAATPQKEAPGKED